MIFSKSKFFRRIETILSDRRGRIKKLTKLALAGTLAAVILSLGLAVVLPIGYAGNNTAESHSSYAAAPFFSTADFNKVRPGMTADEVRDLLGYPVDRYSLVGAEDEVHWVYTRAASTSDRAFRKFQVIMGAKSGQVIRATKNVESYVRLSRIPTLPGWAQNAVRKIGDLRLKRPDGSTRLVGPGDGKLYAIITTVGEDPEEITSDIEYRKGLVSELLKPLPSARVEKIGLYVGHSPQLYEQLVQETSPGFTGAYVAANIEVNPRIPEESGLLLYSEGTLYRLPPVYSSHADAWRADRQWLIRHVLDKVRRKDTSYTVGKEEEDSSDGIKEDPALLKKVAEGWKANREKISTWKGEARVEHGTHSPGDKKNLNVALVRFAYSRELGAKRWNWKRQDNPSEKNCMIKDNRFYDYRAQTGSDPEGKWPRHLLISPKDEKRIHHLSDHFDPFYYLGPRGESIFKGMNSYRISFDSPNQTGAVYREDDVVVLKTDSGWAVQRYEIDVSKGCNCTLFRIETSDQLEEWKAEYTEIDGVFVPEYVEYRNVSDTDKGREVYQRTVRFSKQQVNEPLGPEEFTLESLGVQKGDIIHNRIKGTRRPYPGPDSE